MALSADRTGTYFRETLSMAPLSLPVGTDIIYKGALVGLVPGTGTIVAGADTANMIFAGMALENVDNSAGASGVVCKVQPVGIIRVTDAGSLAAANVGTVVTLSDDETIDIAANTTNDVEVGRLYEVDSNGAWVGFMSQLVFVANA